MAARYLLPVLLQLFTFTVAHSQDADTAPDYLAPSSAGRHALVLGNEQYLHVNPVKNAINDADAVAAQLDQLGFGIVKRLNSSRSELFTAVDELSAQLDEGDVVAVFYAGHGLESEHVNFLLPVEAREWPAARVPYETLPTSYLLESIMSKRPSAVVLILDACRGKPFLDEARGPDDTGGLASEDAPTGVLIAFAAAPGAVAWSGTAQKPSSNSIYTTALIKHIRTPSAQIENIFKQVRSAVLAASKDQQRPWESTSLLGDIVLMPTAEDLERDKKVWTETLNTGDRSIIASFVRQFPTSQFAGTARKWLQNESQRPPSGDFEPSVWAGNIESPSMIWGTQDFRSLAIATKVLQLIVPNNPSSTRFISKGTPLEVLRAPDEQGRALVKTAGETGFISGVLGSMSAASLGSRTGLLNYQENGALPDRSNTAIAELAQALRAIRKSEQDRFLWQLDVDLPKCAKAKCAGGFTPRQLAWMNALRVRSAIAKQSADKKSLVIRVSADESSAVENAIGITSTVEASQ